MICYCKILEFFNKFNSRTKIEINPLTTICELQSEELSINSEYSLALVRDKPRNCR